MYLNEKPVLYILDVITTFEAGWFLNDMSAKDKWKALSQCWINTYPGPPDMMTYNVDTNFNSIKFHTEARILDITCHQIFVKAH